MSILQWQRVAVAWNGTAPGASRYEPLKTEKGNRNTCVRNHT